MQYGRTFESLIPEVQAQIAVDDDTAFDWLLDRARVLNAEAAWDFQEAIAIPNSQYAGRVFQPPDYYMWIEAVIVGGTPYQRSTLHALDARYSGNTGNTHGIYADDQYGYGGFQIHPPSDAEVLVRYVRDVSPDRTIATPFPSDFNQALVDGAVAIGLSRMDERLDSAAYFDAKFGAAIERLKRRRHARVGRGATSIRVVQ